MRDTITTTMKAAAVTKDPLTGTLAALSILFFIFAMLVFWYLKCRSRISRGYEQNTMATRSQSGYTAVPLTIHDRKNDSGTYTAKKPVGNIVKLDVGGTIFKTSNATLTKFSGFFRALMETEIPSTEDESGAIFIDRDPAHFRLILNFMRDSHVDLPESLEDVKEIRNEAEYYQLDGLLELCENVRREELGEKNVSRKLNYLNKTAEEMLQLIANIENRPLVVITCSTNGDDTLINLPKKFQCGKFMQEFQDRYDIYFRLYAHSGWWMDVYDETSQRVYCQDLDEMDECLWKLRNNLAPIPEEQQEDRLHNI